MEREIIVTKAGRKVESIRRSIRLTAGGPSVAYRGRLWPLVGHSIDLAGASFQADAAAGIGGRKLDASQDAVVIAPVSDRTLVVAGPGSGKTDVAARKLMHLVRSGTACGKILVLSFSRSAVRTLTQRIQSISEGADVTLEELRHLSIRTFDSWAFRVLRLRGYSPADLLVRRHDENIALLTELLEGPSKEELRPLIGDKAHVIVDEFQDLPGVRGRMVLALLDLLAPAGLAGAGFTVLGDPAQAIYQFGARNNPGGGAVGIDYWEVLKARYAEELKRAILTQNHRSSPEIAAFAAELRGILEKKKLPDAKKLDLVRERLSRLPEVDLNFGPARLEFAAKGNAILTRSNGEAIRVAQKLCGNSDNPPDISFRLVTAGRSEARSGWIGALLGPSKSGAISRQMFDKIHAHWSAKLDDAIVEALALPDVRSAWERLLVASGADNQAPSLDLSALRERLNWPDAFPDDEGESNEGVLITTIHQSKGREFSSVVLLDPGESSTEQENKHPDEEAFVDFVAVTRARTKLQRLSADSIHPPPTKRSFPQSRERRCRWWGGWVNLEAGIPGDVLAESFVDPAVHDSIGGVQALQTFLIENSARLIGHRVVLIKVMSGPKQASYDIHLQEDGEPARRLGRCGGQLVKDLLHLLWNRGYSLPGKLFNLRISAIRTLTSPGDDCTHIAAPFQASRLWLGVELAGTADFRSFKRSS
jgi:hypothetical protein